MIDSIKGVKGSPERVNLHVGLKHQKVELHSILFFPHESFVSFQSQESIRFYWFLPPDYVSSGVCVRSWHTQPPGHEPQGIYVCVDLNMG